MAAIPNGEYKITSKLHPKNVLAVISNTVVAVENSSTTWDLEWNKNTGDYTIIEHGNKLNGYLDYVLHTTQVMTHKPHKPVPGLNQRWTITDAGENGYAIQSVAVPQPDLTTALNSGYIVAVTAVQDEALAQSRWVFAERKKPA